MQDARRSSRSNNSQAAIPAIPELDPFSKSRGVRRSLLMPSAFPRADRPFSFPSQPSAIAQLQTRATPAIPIQCQMKSAPQRQGHAVNAAVRTLSVSMEIGKSAISAVGRTIPSKRIIPIMQAAQIEKALTRPDRGYANSVRFPSHFRHSYPLTVDELRE